MNDISKVPMKVLVQQDKVQRMLENTLKGKTRQFTTSLINVVNSNQSLADVDQMSVIKSAMVAASLDLPIDQNLGFMWLVPYKGMATPQIGYKGYIQLALRTGQYKKLNTIVVHEGEMKYWNPLTEDFEYDPKGKESDEVIGYLGYLRMINGFEKTVYWTKQNIEDHRMKFSKMSGKAKPSGVWASNYDAMALKTVMRNLLSKWGIMSIEMQQAVVQDEKAPETDVRDVTPTETNSIDSLLAPEPKGEPINDSNEATVPTNAE
ncbi:recombinase RecT [Pediococcus pentosaceus]|uniref:recombinase RecT n=1 Tax=Pediococcus pentosaceus TaxID=1255 RepID=UPI0015E06633|nr:recombinase RecT [Pediococcus pentosaceus]